MAGLGFPTLLNPLSCCSVRCGRPEWGGSSKDDEWDGLELEVSALKRQGRKPTPAAGLAPALLQDPGHVETLRLAEQLLPNGLLTRWQRSWRTPENVNRYYSGRGGNPADAAGILAKALQWREEYREVLSGEREPRWQTDLRVLARGDDGCPIIYGCFRFNVPATAATTTHIVEHMAAVMEAASRARRPGATGADNIMDCHGYRVADNLNPAPMLALMKMAAQPYRDGLRTAMIVDAPRSFSLLWHVAAPLLSEKTRNKIRFVSKAEAVELIASQSGEKTAAIVDRVMSLNREAEGCRGSSFPSELRDDDEDAEEEEGRMILRSLSRKLTRDLSGVQSVVRESSLKSRLGCCRRRRIVPPSSTSSHGSGKEHAN
mmetsp:Transcript_88164/g.224439  ORF Transcript_88164/g.224439 Transcript_88164/m.224439 type:complete len:374 (+) Transcript_88164:69-1190(+)